MSVGPCPSRFAVVRTQAMIATKLYPALAKLLTNGSPTLIWLAEMEMGYYPVNPCHQTYNRDYFAKYEAYAKTKLGRELTEARKSLVADFYDGPLVDIGIGCGQFVDSRPQTYGFDIGQPAVNWLALRGLMRNPYGQKQEAISCWDSLEHLPDPAALLKNVKSWVFVSLPIFQNFGHILTSKHFRKDEHYWYWTERGFKNWMKENGFECRFESDIETKLGREDIYTFVFQRL